MNLSLSDLRGTCDHRLGHVWPEAAAGGEELGLVPCLLIENFFSLPALMPAFQSGIITEF